MVAACGYGSTPLGLFTVLIPCPTMYLSSWEQYHTGILYLGFFNGPCEGIIIACTIMGLAATYGPGFYHQQAMNILPFVKDPSIMVHHLFVVMCLFAFFGVHLPAWYHNFPALRLTAVFTMYIRRGRHVASRFYQHCIN